MFDTWPTDAYAQTAFNAWSQSPYFNEAGALAQQRGIDPGFFTALIGSESGYDPNAVNPNGQAVGIAQFKLKTAQDYGVNRYDPESSLTGAANLLQDNLASCQGDYVCAATRYGTLTGEGNDQNKNLLYQIAQNITGKPAVTCTNLGDVLGAVCTGPTGADASIFNTAQAKQAKSAAENQCGSLITDFECYVTRYAADALTILAGLAILIIGIVMLRDSSGIVPAVSNLTTKSIRRIGEAVAA